MYRQGVADGKVGQAACDILVKNLLESVEEVEIYEIHKLDIELDDIRKEADKIILNVNKNPKASVDRLRTLKNYIIHMEKVAVENIRKDAANMLSFYMTGIGESDCESCSVPFIVFSNDNLNKYCSRHKELDEKIHNITIFFEAEE